jgi:hypothetical protein
VERVTAREQFVGDHAGRVQIGLRRDLAARGLLGRHVGRGADDLPGRRPVRSRRHLADGLRDPEVGDLRVPVGRDQHVLRLEVAVDDPVRGGLGEPAEHALEHAGRLGERQPPDEWP